MHEPPVMEMVQRAMGELTPAERKVGRTLIAAYPVAGLETMPELAERAEVSVATVLRFVTRLGFDGYPAFQRRLREEIQERIASPLTLYGSRSAPIDDADVLASGRRVFVDALEATFANLPPAEFHAAVDLLADKRLRISCTGGRLSQILAVYLGAHLQALRANTRVLGDGLMPRVDHLVDLGQRDVLVVFDYRRYQTDTIDFARRAQERGAVIVLFTDPWLSPVAGFARHVLPTSIIAPSPFDSLAPAMAAVETLIASLSARLADQGRLRVKRMDALRAGFVLS